MGIDTEKADFFPVPWTKEVTVFLVDTPGFDVTNKTDTEVLKEIAASLASLYDARIMLRGIIYLHQIRQNRLDGSAIRNLRMLRKFCGEDALKSVTFALTMWDKVTKETGEKNETELTETRDFRSMIDEGSTVHHHDRGRDSALKLVKYIAQMEPVVMALQRELVDEALPLNETQAGQEVKGGLTQRRQQAEREVKALQEDLEEAHYVHDEQAAVELEKQKENMERRIEQVLNQQRDLEINLEQIYTEKEAEIQKELLIQRETRSKIEAKLAAESTRQNEQRSKHDTILKKYESRTASMTQNPPVGAAAGPNNISRWPVSMSMFGDLYWFNALVNNFG